MVREKKHLFIPDHRDYEHIVRPRHTNIVSFSSEALQVVSAVPRRNSQYPQATNFLLVTRSLGPLPGAFQKSPALSWEQGFRGPRSSTQPFRVDSTVVPAAALQ